MNPTTAVGLDADFEKRWAAWKARGIAHDRAVKPRLVIAALVGGVIALTAAVAYSLFSS